MSRFLLVELEPDLDHKARYAAWQWCKLGPAVRTITDLAMIDQTTLDIILLKPTPAVKAADPALYKAIRRHQQRQQPDLFDA